MNRITNEKLNAAPIARNFLALCAALVASAGLTGCDVEDLDAEECTEGEMCNEPLDEPPESFNWVLILDNSYDENLAGTPGVDICGVEVICDGESLTAADARLHAGAGDTCTEMGPQCAAPRDMAEAALDRGLSCEPDSSPISDYVSVGIGGVLALEFDRDLRGCEINVVEHQGRDEESFEGYVCANDGLANCLTNEPSFTAPYGGSISAAIAAASDEQ